MTQLPQVVINLEFEPVVKLTCINRNCKHNLMNCAIHPEWREAACNLKQIAIDDEGKCSNYEHC